MVERFTKDENGVITDAKTGKQWLCCPDPGTNFDDAEKWVKSLAVDGGKWRMPTLAELMELYRDLVGSRNMDPIFDFAGWWVWASDKCEYSSGAWGFDFRGGKSEWDDRSLNDIDRALAVRNEDEEV